MKRDARLRSLSRDHHHALVLARYIAAICARNGMDADLVALVRERFAAEISPHFAIEETLLDALQGCGVDDLVLRTRREHAEMLRLLDASTTTDPKCLCELGQLLNDHVRFEERELYPTCEELLARDILERVANAH
jgi:Hemerythrin HHE cation binding domain